MLDYKNKTLAVIALVLTLTIASTHSIAGFIENCDNLTSAATSTGPDDFGICYNASTNEGAFFGTTSLLNTDVILYNENYSGGFENLFNFNTDVFFGILQVTTRLLIQI